MGNLLDKLFKEKLTQREIDFDPQNWEAMEKLLDKQPLTQSSDKTNSSSSYRPYIFAGIAICLIAIGFILLLNDKTVVKEKNDLRQEVLERSYAHQRTLNDKYKTELSQAQEKQLEEEDLEEKISANLLENSKQKNDLERRSIVNNRLGTSSIVKNNQLSKKQSTQTNSLSESPFQASPSVFDHTNGDIVNTELSEVNQKVELRKENFRMDNGAGQSEGQKANNLAKSTVFESLSYLSTLPIDYFMVDQRDVVFNMHFEHKISEIQKVVKKPRRPEFGFYAAYEFAEGNKVYNLGFFKTFKLGQNWSISIEPAYANYQMTGDSLAREVSEFFSFGSVAYEQHIISEEMHSIQLPIMLQRSFGNTIFGMGLIYEHALAVKADRITLIDGELTEQEQIWLDPIFYQSSLFRAKISAAYQLSRHINTGVTYEMPLSPQNAFNNRQTLGFILKYSI